MTKGKKPTEKKVIPGEYKELYFEDESHISTDRILEFIKKAKEVDGHIRFYITCTGRGCLSYQEPDRLETLHHFQARVEAYQKEQKNLREARKEKDKKEYIRLHKKFKGKNPEEI